MRAETAAPHFTTLPNQDAIRFDCDDSCSTDASARGSRKSRPVSSRPTQVFWTQTLYETRQIAIVVLVTMPNLTIAGSEV